MTRQTLKKQIIRTRYEEKRRKDNWTNKKKIRIIERRKNIYNYKSKLKNIPINLEAPTNFSLIENTNEIIRYFNNVKNTISSNKPARIDISKITNLTPDIIILLISTLKDKKSMKIGISGNAPEDPLLRKMFLESGLYSFVKSTGPKKISQNNKLWMHSYDNKVKGEIAGEAVMICKKLFLKNNINYNTDNIYNLIVEAMSNTITHADKNKTNINWWLYYFIDEQEEKIKYSFIDLGIGIFESASFDSFRQKFKFLTGTNSILVKPFLDGKIISSREKDNDISGKGIKQIINCAKNKEFTSFTIITNDQKINVKEKTNENLNFNFEGTFINFEISYSNQITYGD